MRGTDSIQRLAKTGASFCSTSTVSVMWKWSAVAWIVRSDVDVVVPEGRTMRARCRPNAEARAGSARSARMRAGERTPHERRVVHAHVALDGDLDLGAAAEDVARDAPGRWLRRGRVALHDDGRRPEIGRRRAAARRYDREHEVRGRGGTSLHLARCRLGRRPHVRPVGVGDADAQPVTAAEDPARACRGRPRARPARPARAAPARAASPGA